MYKETAPIEQLIEKVVMYSNTSISLVKLTLVDKIASLISTLTSHLFVGVFLILLFLMLNIGLGLWLGELCGKNYYGFFILTVFYTVVAIVVVLIRKIYIKEPIRNSLIAMMLKEMNHENN